MQRRFKSLALAGGFAALVLSGGALAQTLPNATFNARTFPNSSALGPVTITPPSDADGQRLIVDVDTRPLDVNLYAGATRVASKQSITYPAGTYYSFKEAVDLPGLPE
ncbi:MAG TPA: hypothetical protein VFB36_17165 [Nevskiaceae bacterium]|nr:hypothetical protein [Nevskiaceae bacterium]